MADDNNLTEIADDENSIAASPNRNQNTPGAEKLDNPSNQSKSTRISQDDDIPGRRLSNPLGQFASYTYQLTLYMVTPDAYDAFVQTGRQNINVLNNVSDTGSGAYIVAQSGGINEKVTQRAPGFKYDYYIDNLSIDSTLTAASSQTATNVTDVKFTITEPYGFSFLSNLRRTSDSLMQYTNSLSQTGIENPTRQFFILGIRFFGYDINGKLITDVPSYGGDAIDPNQTSNGVFERFYDIIISAIKFKIDGKVVVYDISAKTTPPQTAFGAKRGILNSASSLNANTVEEALSGSAGLLTRLNNEQQRLVDAGVIKEKNEFKLKFIGDAAIIANSTIVSPADLDKYRWAPGSAKTSNEVNDASARVATPNPNSRTITFASGTPILMAVQQIITQSSYLEDALKIIYNTNLQPDPKKNDQSERKTNEDVRVRWYNLSAELSNPRWDEAAGDFAYTITYLIQSYETPIIQNSYSNPGTKFYGPHKRYEYWYSGKNTEILRYEQNLDNLYYNAVMATRVDTVGTSIPDAGKGGATDIPQVPRQRTPMPRLGRLNIGMEAQNAYLTDLYSPDAYVHAKLSILGDPDFLVHESASSQDALYDRFYGPNGFTINPNGGQVFIEIDFKEADDYDDNSGLLRVNDSIRFWKYPKTVSSIVQGVSYMVISVKSKFSNGRFTQDLDCKINTFAEVVDDPEETREEPRPQISGSGPTSAGTGTTSNTGLRVDPVAATGADTTPPATVPITVAPSPGTVSTPIGGVADDDLNPITITSRRLSNEPSSRISFDGTNWNDERGNPIPTDDVGRPLAS